MLFKIKKFWTQMNQEISQLQFSVSRILNLYCNCKYYGL